MANEKDIEENKAMAAIAYLGILFLVPLLAKKDSPYAQFHAKQGMVLFIAAIIAQVGWFLMVIPIVGWIIDMVLWIGIFVLFIIGITNALSGKMQPLPIIGQLGEKINI